MRRRFLPALGATLCLVQMTQVAPARAAGPPVCADAGVGAEAVTLSVELPDACPQIDFESIARGVLPPDPGVWDALAPTAKDLFRPARVSRGPSVFLPEVGTGLLGDPGGAAARGDCAGATGTVTAENSLGMPLWAYTQSVGYCANGRSFTSYKRTRWGEASAGWRFEGHVDGWRRGRPSSASMGFYTKGRFTFGVVDPIFVEEPWIEIWVHVDDPPEVTTGNG